MRLLCIHHEPTSDGGTLLAPARAGGWTIEHWRAHAGEPRPILDGVDAVLAYGGTMNPDDDARLAWLADVRATLAEAVERDLSVLGICLGAQLLGQALGVGAPRLAQPELGWYHGRADRRRAPTTCCSARSRPPARSSSGTTTAASCRPGALPLARSERAPQQAYRVGEAVWAVQFHIEVDADSSSAGRAPSPSSCARAAPTPPSSWRAHAPTSPSTSRSRAP